MRTFAQKQQQSQQRKPASLERSTLAPSVRRQPIRQLRNMIGNQAAQRLLQARGEEREDSSLTSVSPRFAHDFSRIPLHANARPAIQPELTVGTQTDAYELEADRVADQVMRVSGSRLQRVCACGGGCPQCQAEQPGQPYRPVQTRGMVTGDAGESMAPPSVHDVLRSPGEPLGAAARAFFEPRFGQSFHDVRVHTDSQAHRSAQALNAEAYTAGPHIAFAHGVAAVKPVQGARLLAHELAHVVQQGTPAGQVPRRVQRQERRQESEWLPELDEILPGRVGLLTVIDRVTMLIDIFGSNLLEQHVRLIYADAAATSLTRSHGVPAVVALYDTRQGTRLDVAAARQALADLASRTATAPAEADPRSAVVVLVPGPGQSAHQR
jgi:hypothetical protein